MRLALVSLVAPGCLVFAVPAAHAANVPFVATFAFNS